MSQHHQFASHLEKNLEKIAASLREGTYKPQKIRQVEIPKAGSKEKRPLGIPTVRDRVVQTAVKHVIEPVIREGILREQLRIQAAA